MTTHLAATPPTAEQVEHLQELAAALEGPWEVVPWHIAEGPPHICHKIERWILCELPSDAHAELVAGLLNHAPTVLAALAPAERALTSEEQQIFHDALRASTTLKSPGYRKAPAERARAEVCHCCEKVPGSSMSEDGEWLCGSCTDQMVEERAEAVPEWCQTDRRGPRKFVLWFEDRDVGFLTYDTEAEARDAFDKANTSYNCYLFASMPASPTRAGALGAAAAAALARQSASTETDAEWAARMAPGFVAEGEAIDRAIRDGALGAAGALKIVSDAEDAVLQEIGEPGDYRDHHMLEGIERVMDKINGAFRALAAGDGGAS
jgi:hypothetical protein